MSTEKPRLQVSLPKELVDQFRQWRLEQGFVNDTQGLTALIEQFFAQSSPVVGVAGTDQKPESPSPDHAQRRLESLEDKLEQIHLLGLSLVDGHSALKEALVSQQSFTQALENTLQHHVDIRLSEFQMRLDRLEVLKGGVGVLPASDDHLPDDEPDEVLTEFLTEAPIAPVEAVEEPSPRRVNPLRSKPSATASGKRKSSSRQPSFSPKTRKSLVKRAEESTADRPPPIPSTAEWVTGMEAGVRLGWRDGSRLSQEPIKSRGWAQRDGWVAVREGRLWAVWSL